MRGTRLDGWNERMDGGVQERSSEGKEMRIVYTDRAKRHGGEGVTIAVCSHVRRRGIECGVIQKCGSVRSTKKRVPARGNEVSN